MFCAAKRKKKSSKSLTKSVQVVSVHTFTKHRDNLAKWLSLDELRYRPAVFTSTCTRPSPLHIRALPPISSRYSLTEGVADDKPSAGGQRHRPLAALVSATKLATHLKSNVRITCLKADILTHPLGQRNTVYRVSTNRFYQKDIPEESKATVSVELYRESDSSWGIGISGGADKGYKPFISCVRAGSIADRSDSILVGDHLLEVNGIRVETLTYNEILNLLKNAGQHISLLTAYNLNDLSFIPSRTCIAKTFELKLEKEERSIGFVVRGGRTDGIAHPVTVVHIRSGGPVNREGRLRIGDRILAINGIDLRQQSLARITDLLSKSTGTVRLSVEYDVLIIDSIKNTARPILLEIDKPPGCDLGVRLQLIGDTGYVSKRIFRIVGIVPASIADRCGAFSIGDELLSVDGVSLQLSTPAEVKQLLKGSIRSKVTVEIQPCWPTDAATEAKLSNRKTLSADLVKPASTTATTTTTTTTTTTATATSSSANIASSSKFSSRQTTTIINSSTLPRTSNGYTEIVKEKQTPKTAPDSGIGSCSASPGSLATSISGLPHGQICRSEVMEVVLNCSYRGGYGLIFHRCHVMSECENPPLIISYIEKGSPAEKCGVLQIGDRVLALNDWCTELGSAEQANQFVKHMTSPLTLTVEFDVIESVLQNCGIFTVKLARRTQNLGLLIRPACGNEKGEPVIVAEVEIGSVAYRCGTIQPGDQILAIDNIPLDSCTVEEANRLLDRSSDVVKLRIKKYCCSCERVDCGGAHMIVYSIEINRRGCPLGIAVSAGDEHLNHVLITQLVAGGLAEKTGAIHVGDRLLAINGRPLDRLPIQEVARLLQEAPELLTLKIGRSPQDRARLNQSNAYQQQLDRNLRDCIYQQMPNKKLCTPVQSVDSAVESLEDCPIVESLPHLTATKRSKSSSLSIAGAENSHDVDGLRDSMKLKECAQLNNNNIDELTIEWCKVLEALESIGEPETLVKLEETILAGAVPCVSNCVPQLVPPPMPKVSSPPTTNCQKTILRRPQTCSPSKIALQSGNPSRHPDGLLRVNYVPGSTPVSRTASPKCTDLNAAAAAAAATVYEQIPFVDESDASSQQRNTTTAVNTVLTVHVPQAEKLSTNAGSGSTTDDSATPTAVRLHRLVLRKDQVHNDFGFSISDGVEERGIFVRDIRPNGPADKSRNIFPYDRILKVNDISVQDVDCLLVAPLLAACGDKVELLLSRTALLSTARQSNDHQSHIP
ncbi:Glutamate receptor-interacting protein 1 [Trichinella spiralis]|uniref:Glutamate receptor-interacting protein 1 n=1 Tax=Trichinella spiralis TaxID=6334 RepID=A0A0V1B1W1_TRISP|nr:Glutamate receptor-interacting protein 1 [Trichinella spiralis]